MRKRLLVLLLYLGVATAQDCDNVCYQGVKSALENLIELYKKSPSVSNIPPNFDDIKSLINRTENIIPNIKNLDDVKNVSQTVYDNITHSARKLRLFRKVVDQIYLINKAVDELKRKKEIRNEAFKQCDEANKLYGTLRNDVKEINETGNAIKASFDSISQCIDRVKEQSIAIKNDLDTIVIPEVFYQKFLCNSSLSLTIQDVINTMRNIEELLKSLFQDIIGIKLKELEDDVAEDQKTIEAMEDSLNELPDLEGLKDLLKEVEDLKNELKKALEDLFEDARKRLKDLIDEYETILSQLFSEENIDKVKDEIEKARETLRLLKERNAIKAELEDIKVIINTLKENGICFINETVTVEDKLSP